MKYLEVKGARRPEVEGRHRMAACRGKEDRSLIRCVMPFWGSSLRPNLLPLVVVVHWFFILVYWVRFFFILG